MEMQGRICLLTRGLCRAALVGVAVAAMASAVLADTKIIYVATTGSDTSGTGSFSSPYATIDKARQVIRSVHPLQHPYEVRIRGGVYYLPGTLTFTSADSGTAACPITYLAYNGEDVVISGGKPINLTWWKQNATLWNCRLADVIPDYASRNIRHIWKDGVRQTLARYPNVGQGTPAGYMLTATATNSQTMATVPQANVHGDWTGGEFISFGPDTSDIANNMVQIASVSGNNIYYAQSMSPYFAPQTRGRRCYVRNVFSEMDSPGEWFLGTTPGNFADGWLYVYNASETPPTGQYVVGYLETLFKLDDPSYQPISYINFRGLKFTQTTCTDHSQYFVPWQFAVVFRNADHCVVEDCEFVDLAGHALVYNPYCEYLTIKGCKFSYIDACAIVVIPEGPGFPDTPDYYTYNLISGNEIHHIGELYSGADAISLSYTSYNTYENNYIHDIPCHAFCIAYSTLGHNVLRNNEMRNVMLQTGDGGAIHTFPMDMSGPTESGNELSGNLVVNSKGYYYDSSSVLHNEWGYAYYIDNTSQGWSIHDNVAKDCFGGLMFHGTRECDVYNNFWVNNLRQSSFWCTTIMVDPDLMGWFNIHQNISYANSAYTQHEIFGGANAEWMTGHGVTINSNMFYPNGAGTPRIPSRSGALDNFGGTGLATWSQWRNTYGFDTTNLVANPLFQNISADDYRLQAGSTATSLGIHGIDFSIAITSQPVSKTVFANQRATFSVAVTGNAPRYQWCFRPKGGSSFSAIPGAIGSSFTIDSVKPSFSGGYPMHVGDYRCDITNCRGAVSSNVVSLRIRGQADCDGDGDTDIGEWYPLGGYWWTKDLGIPFTYGTNGVFPFWDDFDGDGKMDAAVFDGNGDMGLGAGWNFTYSGGGVAHFPWGAEGQIPISGDFDGDGDTDFGVFIAATGSWSIYPTGNLPQSLGQNGDIPMPADYDGDGRTDQAVFRPGSASSVRITYSGGGTYVVTFGSTNDIPVYGDYNGDGLAEFGVFTGTQFRIYGIPPVTMGQPGDIPLMGDFDRDGITDYAVYHPDLPDGNSDWLITYSSDGLRHDVTNWGSLGRAPFACVINGWNGIITKMPVSQTVSVGGTATFSVVAQGTNLSYQWYKDGAPITGATLATYTKASVGTTDAGAYKCRVTNWKGYANRYSYEAQLTVNGPTTPVVTDDGAYTTNTTQLHATWTATDPVGIAEYQYAIGTSVGATNIVNWTTTGTTANVTRTGLLLNTNLTYYFSVKARNPNNIWSFAGNSDGIRPALTATSIASMKGYPDGTCVCVTGRVVSAEFGDSVYIQDPNRLSGIKVMGVLAKEGATVTLTGILSTSGFERTIVQGQVQ